MDALTPGDWALVLELMTRARAKMGISMAGAAATYLPDAKLLVAINLIQMEKDGKTNEEANEARATTGA